MIAKEGYSVVFTASIIGVVLIIIGYIVSGWLFYLLTALGLFTIGFTLYFFRDPNRKPKPGTEDLLIAPADGKVIQIIEVDEPKYIGGKCKQVSIFLSPLDVHINYVPCAGKVEFVKYHEGEYLVAWHEKASELNERSEFGVLHPSGNKVFFRQITGYVARRIVYNLNEGDDVYAGQRFGMMKFGSRMDILVPLDCKLKIKPGDRTVATQTIMGELV